MSNEYLQWMWFGKIPGLGDFADRRIPEALKRQLDEWLQLRLHDFSTSNREKWVSHYLSAPIWRFVLGTEVADVSEHVALTGICMPSVDKVGRYFPLIIIGRCALMADTPEIDFFENDLRLNFLSTVALKALDEDWGADTLDHALSVNLSTQSAQNEIDLLLNSLSSSQVFSFHRISAEFDFASLLAVKTRQGLQVKSSKSLWYRRLEPHDQRSIPSAFLCEGLPDQTTFNALMGC